MLILSFHDGNSQQNTDKVLTAVENLSSGVSISCKFTEGIPHWLINGSFYDLNHITFPFIELDGIYGIRFTRITVCLNDTTFQCISSQFIIGRITRLIVIEGKFVLIIYNYHSLPCH